MRRSTDCLLLAWPMGLRIDTQAATEQEGTTMRRLLMVFGLVGVCLAAPAQAGFAATPDPVATPGPVGDGGGGITPAGAAPPDSQQAKDKVAATVLWAKAAAGGDVAGARRAEAAYESKYGGPGGGSSKASSTVASRVMTSTDLAAAFPTSRSLGVVQVGQLKSYYCGPASGYEIIRYLHGAGFSSRFDGTAAGQGGLANANHMETDKYSSTDWARGGLDPRRQPLAWGQLVRPGARAEQLLAEVRGRAEHRRQWHAVQW